MEENCNDKQIKNNLLEKLKAQIELILCSDMSEEEKVYVMKKAHQIIKERREVPTNA